MKKLLSVIVALVLVLGTFAVAETEVFSTEYSFYDMTLNKYNNRIIAKENRGDLYYIIDADGNRLSDGYANISCKDNFFKVSTEESVNSVGLADSNGTLVVPCEYIAVEVLSDAWQVGSHVVDATEDNYDYYTFGSNKLFFIVDYYDVYFKGAKVGTLGRTDYKSGKAHGDYLGIRNTAGDYTAYTSTWEQSPMQLTSLNEYVDVRENGQYVYYHFATGKQAFVPGCELNENEVESLYMCTYKGVVYDLQGNVVTDTGAFSTSSYLAGNDYIRVTSNLGKGLADINGNMLIPAEFDSVEAYMTSPYNYFPAGFNAVYKDDKLCFIDMNGNITVETRYNNSVVRLGGPAAYVKDTDGTVIVITATAGELPERFLDVSMRAYDSAAPIFAVQKTDKSVGVIGMNGEEIIPFSGAYRDTYNIEVSYDGSVILAKNGDTKAYTVFNVNYEMPEVKPAAPDNSWYCPECGAKNESKFCPNDGTKKPE